MGTCTEYKTLRNPKAHTKAHFRDQNWSAANGGFRNGGLSKSEDICGKRPSSSVFWISQCSSHPPEKCEKGRERAKKAPGRFFGRFPGRAARHPLRPQLLHPHLRQPNKMQTKISKLKSPNFCIFPFDCIWGFEV